mmetsp:Transcript_6589/g.10576  ORF Transcript_6589/g.10576 Transcript_6589/m.10576 type:complete len:126 (-) Transcript_6589:372-749(-)
MCRQRSQSIDAPCQKNRFDAIRFRKAVDEVAKPNDVPVVQIDLTLNRVTPGRIEPDLDKEHNEFAGQLGDCDELIRQLDCARAASIRQQERLELYENKLKSIETRMHHLNRGVSKQREMSSRRLP